MEVGVVDRGVLVRTALAGEFVGGCPFRGGEVGGRVGDCGIIVSAEEDAAEVAAEFVGVYILWKFFYVSVLLRLERIWDSLICDI